MSKGANYATPEEIAQAHADLLDAPQAGLYGCIMSDPPWTFARRGAAPEKNDRNPDRHYPTMRLKDIKGLPVKQIVAKDAWLFLWTSGPWVKQSIEVLEAWGFKYSTYAFVWCKLNPRAGDLMMITERDFANGTGYTTMANAEIVLLGRKGSPKRHAKNIRQLIITARREHSRKPDQARERIERIVGPFVPKLEMFARQRVPHWDPMGNQVDKFSVAAPAPALTSSPFGPPWPWPSTPLFDEEAA